MGFLQRLHEDLMLRHPWYASYHSHPQATLLNFLILLVVSINMASAIQNTAIAVYQSQFAAAVASEQKLSIGQLTTKIIQTSKQYDAAPTPEAQNAIITTLTALVNERREMLLEMAKSSPHDFLLASLPPGIKNMLPVSIQQLLEQDILLEGTMTVIHVDAGERGPGEETRYDLKESGSGKRYHVRYDGAPPTLSTGSKVRIKGVALQEELVTAGAGGGGTTVVSEGASATSGQHNAILMLVNFMDSATQPWSVAQIASTMFTASNSTNLFYQQNSFGNLSISGDVVGWYTLPISYTTCNSSYYDVATEADKAAVAAGVDLSKYTHRIYLYNSRAGCSWGGMGTIGGNPSLAWIYGYNNSSILAHEFGHNILSHHAQWLKCGTVSIAPGYAGCTLDEYGDPSDVMGYNWSHYNHFVGPRKIGEGWLTASPHMQTVSVSGTYSISSGSNNDASVKVLKIAKPDTSEAYYIDFRQPIGFDSTLPTAFVNGAAVRIWNGSVSSQTKLVDTSPGDNSALNAPLLDGRSFVDPTNGITITQLAHGSSTVTLSVQFATLTCTRSAPTLTISPLTQDGASSVSRSYSLSFRNNDGSGCNSSTFNLSSSVPSGWAATLSPLSLTLASGASGSAMMTVTPPSNTPDGSYSLIARLSDPSTSVHSVSTNATYVSYTPDSIAPTTSITAPGEGASVSGQLTVSASASDNVGVQRVELWRNGILDTTDTSSPYSFAWDTTKSANGAYALQTKAYDAAGNSGSSSLVNVTVSNSITNTADTLPPTVSIGTNVKNNVIKGSGNVSITASASDASGISSISISIDGALAKTCNSATTCSYSWPGRSISKGAHTISATAIDSSANANQSSASVTLTK